MKLDPVFTVKDHSLFKIEDNSSVEINSLKKIEIKWTSVEIQDESYNEEFLAALRDDLKKLDDSGTFAILVPVVDKPLETPEQTELFTNAYNHTARRIKDCVCVAGIELPDELVQKGEDIIASFIEVLGKKHAQYVYFSKTDSSNPLVVKY